MRFLEDASGRLVIEDAPSVLAVFLVALAPRFLGRAFVHAQYDYGESHRVLFTAGNQDQPVSLTIHHSSLGKPQAAVARIDRFLNPDGHPGSA